MLDHTARITAEGLGAEFCKIMEYVPAEKRLLVRAGVGSNCPSDRMIGASLHTTILQNLSITCRSEIQLHLDKTAALLEHAIESVKQQHPEYSRLEVAGDFRRGSELVTYFALHDRDCRP